MIHWIVGYSLHVLAFATLVMGMLWYEAGKAWLIALLAWIGALVVSFLVLLLWRFIVGDTCCQVMPEQSQPLTEMSETLGDDDSNSCTPPEQKADCNHS